MIKVARHQVGFAFLVTLSFVVGYRPLVDTFALALHNDEYTHLLMIVPVSVALIFLERRPLRAAVTLNVRIGGAILAMAVLFGCFAIAHSASTPPDVQLSIEMFAIVLSWIGMFVICFGYRAAQLVLFPLCFLFGLVPLPKLVLNSVITLLQVGSAWAAHLLFAVFDVPITQNGILLTIPGLTLQVAQECSSLRSSSMLLVTTMVLAQLLLCSSWRKALVIGLAVPLSIAKNGLRIFTIAMLGTRVDPGYLTGRLHHQGGIVFFAIALIGIFGPLWILRRGEVSHSTPR